MVWENPDAPSRLEFPLFEIIGLILFGEEELVAVDSIKTYVKRIKKDLRKIFESDDSTRRKILNQIKGEYENNLRNFEQSQSAV